MHFDVQTDILGVEVYSDMQKLLECGFICPQCIFIIENMSCKYPAILYVTG